MHVVLINGPAGAGKNTMAERIRPLLQKKYRAHRELETRNGEVSAISVEEHKQPLIHMLFAFAESLGVIELGVTPIGNSKLYEMLKNKVMLGRTGRQWQITWADAMRATDSQVFIRSLYARAEAMKLDVVLVPDCGFADEYNAAVNQYGADNVTMIYLDGWQPDVIQYRHYDRFKDDIRVCLRDWASLQNPTPDAAAAYIFGRIVDNAKQVHFGF